MKKLLPEGTAEDEKFVLMDSTHAISASEHLLVNSKGYNPNFNFKKQVRLMYMFAKKLKTPVYYRLINGNITDVASMSLCIKEMEVGNVIYIADKGFFSDDNISAMDSRRLQYIIPLRRRNSIVNYTPLLQADFKKTNKYFVYQKRIIWYYEYENAGRKYTTFLDERLRVEEEQDYLQRIKTHPEKYSIDGYRQRLRTFGTLTLVHYTTSPQSAQQIYEAYKQRNEIDVMFDSYKNFLEADKTYMQNRFVLEGWLFVNFLAMIVYYKLYDRLKNAQMLTKFSPKDIIEIAKMTHQLRIRGVWHRSEMTKKNQDMFKKIKIDDLT
jgi:transposase